MYRVRSSRRTPCAGRARGRAKISARTALATPNVVIAPDLSHACGLHRPRYPAVSALRHLRSLTFASLRLCERFFLAFAFRQLRRGERGMRCNLLNSRQLRRIAL